MTRTPTRKFLALTALFLLASVARGQEPTRAPTRARSAYEDLQMFSQVLNQIRVNHPDSLDTHRVLMAAIEGMVRAVDPHSYVIPAIRLEPAKDAQLREGKLFPVPVDFTFVGGTPVVVSVAAGSSASRLDILPGDELVTVDGKSVSAESATELEIALAGPKNSGITLGLERRRLDGAIVRLDRQVKRERVGEASAVPASLMLDSTTGYIRVTTFMNERVAGDVRAAIGRLESRGMRRLVLDLRDNGGGSVSEAAAVAGEFLPEGAIVYTAQGRKAEITDTARVKRSFWKREKSVPVVVMVNDGTASASELVAGALQDHDRALIVGRPTFGKSLLMRTFPLTDGSLIVLTVGHVRTPCGRLVQRQYRSVSTREYYRLARADRDTAGRSACQTRGGRRVFGGGGIYPDVVLDDADDDVPLWLARAREQQLAMSWSGGYVSGASKLPPTVDAFLLAPRIPAEALADFRSYAEKQGIALAAGEAADRLIERDLLRAAAYAKWGEGGMYHVEAKIDPAVMEAVRSFDKAEAVLRVAK